MSVGVSARGVASGRAVLLAVAKTAISSVA